MKKHWKAISRAPRATVYVTTADTATTPQKNRDIAIKLDAAHRRLALEALGDYALSRGVQLAGPPQQLESTPANLVEVAWLREFASKHNPYPISATVYEEGNASK